jgi:hypothetical protein
MEDLQRQLAGAMMVDMSRNVPFMSWLESLKTVATFGFLRGHTRKGGACASDQPNTISTKINSSNRNLITVQIRFWTVIIRRQS